MPPNRDVVRDSYLQDIYRIVLEATVESLPEDQAAATWVRTAIEDKEISPETVKTAMEKRFGDKAVLWSSDLRANERALEAGYQVVHGRTLSGAEQQTMSNVGLVHSSDKFSLGFGTAEHVPQSDWTEGMVKVTEYAKRLSGELLGKPCNIQMYRLPNGEAVADWDRSTNTLGFNVSRLGKSWFNEINYAITGLLLHEFSHSDGQAHDYIYYKNLERLAGKAVHLALEKPEVFKI